ncbi:methyltransferase domain-containing protein [candidate division KSB1 bacterium]
MKLKCILLALMFGVILKADCIAQTTAEEKEAIKTVIQEAYVGGVWNDHDTKAMNNGFHESYTEQESRNNHLTIRKLQEWKDELNVWKERRHGWNDRASAEISVLDITENTAVAKVDLYIFKAKNRTLYMTLQEFSGVWKIINSTVTNSKPAYEVLSEEQIKNWEKRTFEWQPPDKIMDVIGVKPGMVIGEIGAGRGRFTLPLAGRVGDRGKIYANDIDMNSLEYLQKRCENRNIKNIETILGEENDPLFPDNSLDMAFLVWVFDAFKQPGEFFRNLKPSLKPGATFVLIQGNNERSNAEARLRGEEVDPNRPTIEERIQNAGIEAGFELARIERFLKNEIIVILRVKDSR